ncbi:MAG: 4-oxalocrotonate tautomerase family protein [Parerythrobacter sp.]
MPVIHLNVTEGLDRGQKRQIIEQFTETLLKVAGKKPEYVHIVINEIPDENWGYAGMQTDEWKRSRAGSDEG